MLEKTKDVMGAVKLTTKNVAADKFKVNEFAEMLGDAFVSTGMPKAASPVTVSEETVDGIDEMPRLILACSAVVAPVPPPPMLRTPSVSTVTPLNFLFIVRT